MSISALSLFARLRASFALSKRKSLFGLLLPATALCAALALSSPANAQSGGSWHIS